MVAENHRKGHKTRGIEVGLRIPVACLNCGKQNDYTPGVAQNGGHKNRPDGRIYPRRFCSRPCFREWNAKRFDRWFATPESLALPQGYDEFLTKKSLPCLVHGCDWVGDNLSIHMNHAHGICADEFKRLAGFNKGTGVVSPSTSRKLSENTIALREAGILETSLDFRNSVDLTKQRHPWRPEAREHIMKARMAREIG